MRLAGRELRRRPRSFLVATAILCLLAVLLLYPSAILDGILAGSTSAVRNAPADLIVYGREANGMLVRSRVEPAQRDAVEAAPGVGSVAGFSAYPFTGSVEGETGSVGLAVLSAGTALGPVDPEPGEALVDRSIHDDASVRVGDTLLVGPFDVPVTVAGFTDGLSLWLLPGVVVDGGTWRSALGGDGDAGGTAAAGGGEGPPEAPAPGGGSGGSAGSGGAGAAGSSAPQVSQALLVTVEAGADPRDVAGAIDAATAGETQAFTTGAAARSMPGVAEQELLFGYMRMVTLGIALVVVGLFLSFMTLERTPLYAVLKALGASSRQLFAGVVVQALSITGAAVLVATAATWALTHIPLDLPTTMRLDRLGETLVALAVTAVSGSVLSLRRVMRVEPASAVG